MLNLLEKYTDDHEIGQKKKKMVPTAGTMSVDEKRTTLSLSHTVGDKKCPN